MDAFDSWRRFVALLATWQSELMSGDDLWQLASVALALALGAIMSRWVHARFGRAGSAAVRDRVPSRGWVPRLAIPLFVLLFSLAAFGVLALARLPAGWLLNLAGLCLLLLLVRALIYSLVHTVLSGPLAMAAEQALAWVLWGVSSLMLFGWLRPITQALDTVALPVAGARITLLDAVRGSLVLLCFVLVGSYLGAFVERRLMAIQHLPIGLRVGTAKVTRVALVIIAIFVALDAVGLNLSAFTVVGGALGVGIGFGLQRIMSNFISGFILLGDRSIRPGDVITIGERFGIVRELRARYVVVRDRDGVDTLIPNENIITSEVINWSYADRNIRLKLPIQISYADDPREAMRLMREAAAAHQRVARDPVPVARVMSFAENGIALELRYWIGDPEDGINNVRSDLYLAIWDSFRAAGISIPFPQRDVRIVAGQPRAPEPFHDGDHGA